MDRRLRYKLNRKKIGDNIYNPPIRMGEAAKKLSDLSLAVGMFINEYEDILLSQRAYDLVDKADANLAEAQGLIETGKLEG